MPLWSAKPLLSVSDHDNREVMRAGRNKVPQIKYQLNLAELEGKHDYRAAGWFSVATFSPPRTYLCCLEIFCLALFKAVLWQAITIYDSLLHELSQSCLQVIDFVIDINGTQL